MFNLKLDRIACEKYEARLVNLLEDAEAPAAETDLAAHLERCPACREALEASRMGRELLQQGLEPAREPDGAFATRVMASIRAQESRRQEFWRPLAFLASRLALSAAVALLLLAVYVYEAALNGHLTQNFAQTEVSEGFPELGGQAASQDEILGPLLENGNGR